MKRAVQRTAGIVVPTSRGDSRGPKAGIQALRSAVLCASLSCCLLVSTVFAAEKPFAAPQVTEHVPVSTAGSLVQVTVSLLLVLAAVFAAGWVVRKLRSFGKFQSDAMSVIADLPLGAKERAVLIQVGSQQLLLGVAPGRVNTLLVLNENVGNALPATGHSSGSDLGATAPAVHPRPDFKAILKRSLGL